MSELRLRSQKVQWLEAEGEVVALDGESLNYLSANASGALLWQELAVGTSRKALVQRLVDAYGIDIAVAERDVDHFLDELDERGLLERA